MQRSFRMKKNTTTLALVISVFCSYGQINLSKEILVRHDTTTLKAEECLWLVHAPGNKNKSVPLLMLEAIQSGKLKAFDPQTNELIPGNKIFTWHQSADTAMVWDAKKDENVIKGIQHKINPENLTRIRIYHDWFLNSSTGKIESRINMFEVMGEVRVPSTNDLIGFQPLFRIRY